MMIFRQLFCLAAAYFIGTVCGGYYLRKLFPGNQPLQSGKNSLGATNIGRSFGKTGFLLTFIFDCSKGMAAAYLAKSWGLGQTWILLTGIMVVSGHIWPWQLKFSGGKGISPFLGAMLIFDYRVVVVIIILLLPLYLWLRIFSISGLIAIAALPVWLGIWGYGHETVGLGILLVIILLFAHRTNIMSYCSRSRQENNLKKEEQP